MLITIVFPLDDDHTKTINLCESIIKNNPIENKPKSKKSILGLEKSEFKIIFTSALKFYQNFISSQHNSENMCTFTPSCSGFSMDAIDKFGSLKGILLTADRLHRCNNGQTSRYKTDPQTLKRIDPIDIY